MKIKWWSFNDVIGSEKEEIFEIDDSEIDKMREAGYTEESIQEWIAKEVKEEVMNYFEWGYEII